MTELSVGTGGGLATNSICWCENCAAGGGGVRGGVACDVKIELLLLVTNPTFKCVEAICRRKFA